MAPGSAFDERQNPGASGLTLACVLSEGPTYDYSHVERLHSQVAAHLRQPFNFVCIQDSPYPGWWAKVSLFEPGRFSGRVLYLDLDVTVTGPLDDLADLPEPFAIINDWNRLGFNSSVMVWDAGYMDGLYREFSSSDMEKYRGDQSWIWAKRFDASTFPRDWIKSYKRTLYLEAMGAHEDLSDMRVMVYHGQPKPWEVDD